MLNTIIYTFFLVFIAELGDKTQLATMLLSAKSNSIMSVFIGSSLALICSSFLGVFVGSYITKYIPPHYIKNSAGVLFIVMGILILSGKLQALLQNELNFMHYNNRKLILQLYICREKDLSLQNQQKHLILHYRICTFHDI